MRKREEIEKAISSPSVSVYEGFVLEVLLDIRDIMEDLSRRYC